MTLSHIAGLGHISGFDAIERDSGRSRGIYPLQLVQPDGRRVLSPHWDLVKDVGADGIRAMYRDMTVARRIDAEAVALQRQGEIGLWAPLLGQEAAQVGSVRALHPDDYAFISYREHAVALGRGVPAAQLTAMWRGTALHNWDSQAYRISWPAIVVGAQTLHATGYALGAKFDKAQIAVIAYFGDGASSQGDVHEAMVFAAHFHVPVVFFCQNNHWAISEPADVQFSTPLAQRAVGYGIASLQVDGNDVLAVLAATRAAVEHARTTGEPSYIEALTYRMGPHTTADDPSRYRPPADIELWRTRDPILRVHRLLEHEGWLDDRFQEVVAQEADAAALEVRRGATETLAPAASTMFDNVYATPHRGIDAEKAWLTSYFDRFAS